MECGVRPRSFYDPITVGAESILPSPHEPIPKMIHTDHEFCYIATKEFVRTIGFWVELYSTPTQEVLSLLTVVFSLLRNLIKSIFQSSTSGEITSSGTENISFSF